MDLKPTTSDLFARCACSHKGCCENNSKYIEKLEDIVKDTVKLTAHVKHMYKNISVAGGKVLAKNAEKKLIDLEKFKNEI